MIEVDSRKSGHDRRPAAWWRWLRWVPFPVVAVASVWAAGRAPSGRVPPRFDWTVTGDGVSAALGKGPHIVYMLVLFLLAVLAVGVARRRWAAALTVVVGVAWELVQTTVAGHHPKVLDLLPDLLGIGLGWVLVLAVVTVVARVRTAQAGP